jgi:hypothetical protein
MDNTSMVLSRSLNSYQGLVIKRNKQKLSPMLLSKVLLMKKERKKSLRILDLLVTKIQLSPTSSMQRPSHLLKSKAKKYVPNYTLEKLPSI